MALSSHVAFDAVDPRRLGTFWCEALGYVEPPPPAPHASWEDALVAWGCTPDYFYDRYAIIDPDGRRQRVRDHAEHLVSIGAHVEAQFDQERGFWMVMRDPEGNEFCVQRRSSRRRWPIAGAVSLARLW